MNETTTLSIINQLFEIEKKVKKAEVKTVFRNLDRIYAQLEEEGYKRLDPTGEVYDITRTDCSANIVGDATHNFVITETLKPIVYKTSGGQAMIVQKGVVLVEGN